MYTASNFVIIILSNEVKFIGKSFTTFYFMLFKVNHTQKLNINTTKYMFESFIVSLVHVF